MTLKVPVVESLTPVDNCRNKHFLLLVLSHADASILRTLIRLS